MTIKFDRAAFAQDEERKRPKRIVGKSDALATINNLTNPLPTVFFKNPS